MATSSSLMVRVQRTRSLDRPFNNLQNTCSVNRRLYNNIIMFLSIYIHIYRDILIAATTCWRHSTRSRFHQVSCTASRLLSLALVAVLTQKQNLSLILLYQKGGRTSPSPNRSSKNQKWGCIKIQLRHISGYIPSKYRQT